MPLVLLLFVLIFFPLNILELHSSASASAPGRDTNTILPGQALAGNDKLVCSTGMYALGFFQTQTETRSKSSRSTSNSSYWYYLGIWINRVPTITPVWVANEDDPIADLTTAVLTISPDGNLAVLNRATKSIIWSTSTQASTNTTANDTVATLTDGGNLIVQRSSSSSDVILWQSFDHPTNSLLPGAKLGRDKVTGLNRRLVSRKNSVDQAPGAYALELDPTGAAQFILVELSSGVTYWSSGEWNGRFFDSIPDMGASSEFINTSTEEYFVTPLQNDNMVMRLSLEVSGQLKAFIWYEQLQDWVISAVQPKSQCDVYAVCGSYSVCNDNVSPSCDCMRGFSIKSLEDWELEDRRGGCIRNSPLDCSDNNKTRGSSSTDGFYSVPCSGLPPNAQTVTVVTNEGECAEVCLSNCSCTAYFFSDDHGCYVWHDELFNVRQQQYSDFTSTNKVEFLKVRLAAKELRIWENHRSKMLVWVVASATMLALFGLVLLLIVWRNRRMRYCCVSNSVQGGNGIVAFRYTDLQQATKGFSSKLGSGGFGSVYKGVLPDGSIIAVKMLEGLRQGEKQFRAEVSSVGMIQHVNLVKLIGFCCEGNKRLLVYEYLPYGSLDVHLYQNSVTFLSWRNRYQIALGVARGLAYLHESCKEYIIHCDIKPENILLDASFTPKIADFGMAKLVQRNFSGVLTTMRGPVGYLAPEWLSGVAITTKVDVYSYGMVLLEIISGRRNTSVQCTSCAHNDAYFPLQVANNLLKGDVQSLVDPKLSGDANMEEVEQACRAACWCIQDKESDRPAMGEIVQILEGLREVDVPPIPKILQSIAGSPLSTVCKLHYFD